ncbi:MAG: hypothetical protein M3094_01880 [Actinomycetia bacterium]|nr:hypothetical protein [Actinomycetes bacterium]
MIGTAYLRAYLPGSRIGPLSPHRTADRSEFMTQNDRFMWEEDLSDDAFYTVWHGTQYACPRNVRVRMIEGILAFANTFPAMPLLSEDERRAYKTELNRLRRETGHSRSHILSNAWHVPLRWFAVFRSTDREVYDAESGTSIRYRTAAGDAIDRLGWARNVLDGAGFAEQVVDRVRHLERWIADFSVDAMIELDYATVARSFPDAELVFDESADDVRASLLALEADDFEASREAYTRVAQRWAATQSFTLSN